MERTNREFVEWMRNAGPQVHTHDAAFQKFEEAELKYEDELGVLGEGSYEERVSKHSLDQSIQPRIRPVLIANFPTESDLCELRRVLVLPRDGGSTPATPWG